MKTLLIAASVLLVICVCWFLFLYKPELSRLQGLKQKTQQILVKLQSFNISQQQIDDLEKEVVRLQDEIALKQAKVISKENLPHAVEQIRDYGKKFGIKYQTILPDYDKLTGVNQNAEASGEVSALLMRVKLQSSYKNFGRFLEHIGNLPFLMSVGDLSLAYNEQIFPELEVMVDLKLYVRNQENNYQVAF